MRNDVARYECTCGSYMEFDPVNFDQLRWAATRFGYRNPTVFINDVRKCCDRPDYMEVNGWEDVDE